MWERRVLRAERGAWPRARCDVTGAAAAGDTTPAVLSNQDKISHVIQDAIDIDLIHIIMINPFDNTERKICELRYTSTAVINQCDYTSKVSAVLSFPIEYV